MYHVKKYNMRKMKNKKLITFILIIFLALLDLKVYALDYPDYADMYLGTDKYENYNRKMFNFNMGLNKYVIRPVHIIWASILPQYAMDRIYGVSNNIEYPIRLISCLVQRDFHNAGNETKRFLVNTTIGLAGMFDPAKHLLKIKRSRDNMDKALSRCNVKSGPYFVIPVINFTTPRDILGRILDVAFNPSTYIGSPILVLVKAGITINRTSYLQSVVYLVESNFADPYTIFKIAFGIDKYIKKNNYDRVDVIEEMREYSKMQPQIPEIKNAELKVSAKIVQTDDEIKPDIYLSDYRAQTPVTDSMRTSLFTLPEVYKSAWNDLSPWNHSFAKKIKMSSVNVFEGRDDYNFRYIFQKNKKAPVVVLYPSTGDGIKANHPIMFAKMFYDAGYSVIIQGNPFQWEFVKSMPEDYRPGLPSRDAYLMRITTAKILEKIKTKYGCKPDNIVILGTSLSGLDVLFMAEQESQNKTLGNAKFISICPPVDLVYAVSQIDNYIAEMTKNPEELEQKVAFISAKMVDFYQNKRDIDFVVTHLPFDEDEAKILTGFLMHLKLSDVIFTIENVPTNKKTDIYESINKMGFEDYLKKYLLSDQELKDYVLSNGFGLLSISDYLKNADNYKIYQTKNDYFVSKEQLKQLKTLTKDKTVIFDNGSHMGFLYRHEFIKNLQDTIREMNNSL